LVDESRFRDKRTLSLFQGRHMKGFSSELLLRAQNKLKIVYSAAQIEDLAVPPGNRLEPLKGERKGYWRIRINDQWRICFAWRNGEAADIEVVDYH